jgi:hypothetical protein
MRKQQLILIALLCVLFCMQAQAQKLVEKLEAVKKVKIMILGVTHFHNPGLDVVNTKVDDVLNPKRQEEIKTITNLLARFKPSKVMLESMTKYDSLHNARYQRYLKNEHKLSRNERQQLGYRLARKLGHKRIYTVDHSGRFPMGKVMEYAKENGQYKIIADGLVASKRKSKKDEEFLKTHSMLDFLIRMNEPEQIRRSHQFYLGMCAKIGKENEYPGIDLVKDWYERNLRIYTNVLRRAEEGDRIVLIFGAGHAPILKHLFQNAIDFEYIEVNDYLKKALKGK